MSKFLIQLKFCGENFGVKIFPGNDTFFERPDKIGTFF